MVDIDRSGIWARVINLLVGAWIFISAFVWPHTRGEMTDTWILGGLIFLGAIGAMVEPRVRFFNTLCAVWLFIATLVIAHETPGTVWNNCIAAIVVFVLSLIPSSAQHMPRGREPLPA